MKRIVSLSIVIVVTLFFIKFTMGVEPEFESRQYRCFFLEKDYLCVPQSSDCFFLYDEQGTRQITFYRLRPFANMPYPEIQNNMPIDLNVRCFAYENTKGEYFFVGQVLNVSELQDVLDLVSKSQRGYCMLRFIDVAFGVNDLRSLKKHHFDSLQFVRCSFPSSIPKDCYPLCRYFSFSGTSIPTVFFKIFSQNKTIEYLDVFAPPVPLNNADFVGISKIKSLRILTLAQDWQPNTDLSPLSKLPHLEMLKLGGHLDVLDLSFTSKMPSLKLETENIPHEDSFEEETDD